MNKEEIQDILEELHLVRPEILQPKARKLFEAIMSIADERDDLLKENKEQEEYITYWQKETDKRQNKIDKAIEYIEWQRTNPQYDNVWRGFECDSLIEILKDSDVDD